MKTQYHIELAIAYLTDGSITGYEYRRVYSATSERECLKLARGIRYQSLVPSTPERTVEAVEVVAPDGLILLRRAVPCIPSHV